MNKKQPVDIQAALDSAVQHALANSDGKVTSYIPELASVSEEMTGIAVRLNDGSAYTAGDVGETLISLQSASKLVVLIGLLEEFGPQKVFSWVKAEPSGDDFASVARLDQFGPLPSNPMLNAGAIALCSHIPGNIEQRLTWLERWNEVLFGCSLTLDAKVLASERRTGDRNRSLAYLMKQTGVLLPEANVEELLETYFCLCSFQVKLNDAAYLPMLLGNHGCDLQGKRVLSQSTVEHVSAIMATCGLYNESGTYLVRTGMPGKSSVSGLILAVAFGHGGVAVCSPRVNRKGNSIRGVMMLTSLAQELNWHFAS